MCEGRASCLGCAAAEAEARTWERCERRAERPEYRSRGRVRVRVRVRVGDEQETSTFEAAVGSFLVDELHTAVTDIGLVDRADRRAQYRVGAVAVLAIPKRVEARIDVGVVDILHRVTRDGPASDRSLVDLHFDREVEARQVGVQLKTAGGSAAETAGGSAAEQ